VTAKLAGKDIGTLEQQPKKTALKKISALKSTGKNKWPTT